MLPIMTIAVRYFIKCHLSNYLQLSKMHDLKDVSIEHLKDSAYLQPKQLILTENGVTRSYDILRVHASVVTVIFNVTRKKLVFVKQFRPAVYHAKIPEKDRKGVIDLEKYPAHLGVTLELCAGTVDKDKSLVEIAKDEILEECGYDVPIYKIERIGSHRVDPRKMAAKQTLFYCEVTDDMKVSEGGGIDLEIIDVVELTVDETISYVKRPSVNSTTGFIYAVYWFLINKPQHCK